MKPRHDPVPGAKRPARARLSLWRQPPPRRPGPDGAAAADPVAPDRPITGSGGAAAALSFD